MAVTKKQEQTDERLPELQAVKNASGENPTGTPATDGNDPSQPAADEGSETANAGKTEKTVKLVLMHKSHTPHYHRCGLTLTKVWAEYEVPKSCVDKIKADKWIEVKDSK